MKSTNACMASILTLVLAAPLAATPVWAEPAVQAAPTPEAPRTYSAAEFYQTRSYGMSSPAGLGFSPDGRSVLISSDQTGVFNAYALPIDGGEPVPLSASTTVATFAESYFPENGRVLLTADSGGGGSELTHVYVRELDGTVRDLTPGETVKADLLGWNAARDTFWITSNARDPEVFDLYAYDADTYEGRLIFENPGVLIADVSPDGRWLAIDKPVTSADSDVYLVDLQGDREPRLVTAHEGEVAHATYAFTPDSRRLVYGTNAHGEFWQAWTHDLATGEKAPLIQADWDVEFVSYSPSGRYRVSALNADASTELTLLDTTTGRPVRLTGMPGGDIGQVRYNADETRIAFTVSSDTSPNDVWTADLATGQARRLLTALSPAINEADLVESVVIRYAASDGTIIPGVLYRPKGASAANPAPAIVMVHGGPGGQSTRGYSAQVQHLVNHGYAVLAANNRGSSGYGKTFFHMDDRAHGEADLQDIVDAGQWLRQQDWVADDQVAVMGGSYGGFLTAAALAFHPEAFDAGINIYGVTNWVRTLESIPAWWGAQKDALFDEMGDPATDAERHRRISPLFHASNIRRPMLVVQGANDPRVLPIESEEIVAAVRANNVPVEYVLFPDEGHGFRRRENRITAQEAYLAFLNRYVRK
ncbi:MAG: alpha/beta fold hydrolase [Brevundimonas sp.]|uniref:S9 family peptidase n=1 Tax=Brevundimonas sp. TaxID=1871086 RepID=UPI00260C28D9|nr:alpha/beta fold hydrolase [Brevundimonas sp.]MDI6623615.1 alpha/beta fold hydrolase [Brevundimonas sp.]MDQ7812798.1 alpha/beta fold hydrolase [Brevundimonas sp.]